mgnify:CR=1 FL=1
MFGKFISAQRKKQRLTKIFMASELKMSCPTYDKIEQSTREVQLVEADKIVKLLDITLNELLRHEENSIAKEKQGVKKTIEPVISFLQEELMAQKIEITKLKERFEEIIKIQTAHSLYPNPNIQYPITPNTDPLPRPPAIAGTANNSLLPVATVLI